jgi:hypothetical protein
MNKENDEERKKGKSTGQRQRDVEANSIEAYKLILAVA